MPKFVQALISAPTREEANRFSDQLVRDQLVAGCLIIDGASRYWWQGSMTEKTYWNVQAFSIEANKTAIIQTIEELASDDCPIIAFFEYDGNEKFLKWVGESVKVRSR